MTHITKVLHILYYKSKKSNLKPCEQKLCDGVFDCLDTNYRVM